MRTIESQRPGRILVLTRRSAPFCVAFGLGPWALAMSACGNTETEKRVAEIQKQADERVAQAERDGKQKLSAMQKQMDQVRAEAAAASAQASDAISKAQASVEDATKAVEAALKKARAAYKEEARTELSVLKKEMAEVAAKAAKTPAKEKTGYSQAWKKVVAQQKEITKDIAAFDKATLETFKTTKAKLDRDLALLKAALRTARAKLPKS